GVFKWWWDESEEPAERFEGKSLDELAAAVQRHGDRVRFEFPDGEAPPETVDFVIEGSKRGKACIMAVPPEDFGVSRDTVKLAESPYCFHRTRLRAFDLKKRGIDATLVDGPPAGGPHDSGVDEARSRTGEDTDDAGGLGDHRMVEVVEHYIDGPDGRKRVLTDGLVGKLLEEEDHPRVPFAALTPYLVPHQFFGES